MQIILDISANTHKNSAQKTERIIRSIPRTDKYDIVLKTQLWNEENPQGDNTRTTFEGLHMFMDLAKRYEYKATASVFDAESLMTLMAYEEIPFVKIACRPELYDLIGYVPRGVPVYYSTTEMDAQEMNEAFNQEPLYVDQPLFCIPKYPASRDRYYLAVEAHNYIGVSDHTAGMLLWRRLNELLQIYECHYVLKRGGNNPDAGEFAKTPDDLKEMLK